MNKYILTWKQRKERDRLRERTTFQDIIVGIILGFSFTVALFPNF